MRKKILIVVDNPIRDLDACLLLAKELIKSVDVILTPMSIAPAECFAHNPDYVLLNYLRPTNEFLAKALNTAGIPWGVMDTEGGVFSKMKEKDETSFTKTIHPDAALRHSLQHYFVWGESLANDLKEKQVYPHEKILCLGTPRMDFYSDKMSFFLGEKAEKRQELTGQNRPVVLINTSFALNNPKFSTKDQEIQRLIDTFNYEAEYVKKLSSDLDQVMDAYLELTDQLCKSWPEIHFVLRPHPFESLKPYQEKLSQNSNISILCEGPVIEWLHICEALIHYKCTTAIEASLLNKPSLSLSQYEHIKDVNDVAEVTDFVSNLKELNQKLQLLFDHKYTQPKQIQEQKKRIEKDLFYKIDGNAHVRISQTLVNFLQEKTFKKNQLWVCVYRLKYVIRNELKLLYRGYLVPQQKRLAFDLAHNSLKRILGPNTYKMTQKLRSTTLLLSTENSPEK